MTTLPPGLVPLPAGLGVEPSDLPADPLTRVTAIDRALDGPANLSDSLPPRTPGGAPAREPSPTLRVDPLAVGIAFALVLMIAQRAIGFARGLLFCRMLSDEQLGQWSAVWSLLLLLPPLASLGLPGSFCRFSEHFRQRGQLACYLRRVGTVSGMTTGLLAGCMLFAPQTFADWIFRDRHQAILVQAMAGALVLVALFNALQSLMESLRQVRVVTWMRFNQGLAFAICGPGLLLLGVPGTLAVIAGFGVSCLVGFLPVLGFVRRNPQVWRGEHIHVPQRAFWARVAPFAAWIWITNLLSNSYESVDRFMLLHLLPGSTATAQAALGQYHSSLIIPQLLSSLAVVVAGIVLPYLSAHWERQEHAEARRILRCALKVLGVCFFFGNVAVLAIAPWLYHGFLQGRYEQGLEILPLSMTFCYWLGLGTLAQTAHFCTERVRLAAGTLGIGLLSNAALNGFLVPRWGLQGAVTATVCANAICLMAILITSHRQGWRCDRGILVVAALPVAFLVGKPVALAVALLLALALIRTNWVFSLAERMEFDRNWQALRCRFAVRWSRASR